MIVVGCWRQAVQNGESIRTIAAREGVPEATINKATCDIRWNQMLAKRVSQKTKLTRMLDKPQGEGRWREPTEREIRVAPLALQDIEGNGTVLSEHQHPEPEDCADPDCAEPHAD